MQSINQTLPLFIQALQSNVPIECQEQEWKTVKGKALTKHQLEKVCDAFCRVLDALEATALPFTVLDRQSSNFSDYFKTYDLLKQKIAQHPACIHSRHVLALRITALRYRLADSDREGALPEKRRHSDVVDLADRLAERAAQWKQSQKLYPTYRDRELSPGDHLQLKEICRYQRFVKRLYKANDSKLFDRLFTWALRDHCPIDPYVQYPATWAWLKDNLVAARIGRSSSVELLAIAVIKGAKVLAMPMFVLKKGSAQFRSISILDPSKKVALYDPSLPKLATEISVGEIVETIGRKNIEFNEIEVIQQGIVKFSYNHIDFSKDQWWSNLPPLETITKKALAKRYPRNDFASIPPGKKPWVAVVRATRSSSGEEIVGSHGFIEMAVPVDGDKYDIYVFGKLAWKFPVTKMERLSFVFKTVYGGISYCDDNTDLPRQQAGVAWYMPPQCGKLLMQLIGGDIQKGLTKELIIQLGYENCAHWVDSLLRRLVQQTNTKIALPNFFKKPIDDIHPFFHGLRRVCKTIKRICLDIIAFLTAAWRGVYTHENGRRKYNCLMTNAEYRNSCQTYIPASLHNRILSKQILGKVWWGHALR